MMIKDNEYIDMAYTVSYMHIFEDGSKNQIKAMLHFAELYHQSEVNKLNIHCVKHQTKPFWKKKYYHEHLTKIYKDMLNKIEIRHGL